MSSELALAYADRIKDWPVAKLEANLARYESTRAAGRIPPNIAGVLEEQAQALRLAISDKSLIQEA